MEPRNDHDLLIELKTLLGVMRDDLREMKDNFQKRLSLVESDVAALQNRFDIARAKLGTWRAVGVIFAAIVTLIMIPILAAYISTGNFHF